MTSHPSPEGGVNVIVISVPVKISVNGIEEVNDPPKHGVTSKS